MTNLIVSESTDKMYYPLIVDAIISTPWAILPEKLAAIRYFMQLKASGVQLSKQEIQAAFEARNGKRSGNSAGAIAVIPVLGTLSQRMNLMTEMSGGTSTEMLGKQIDAAVADPDINAIVLDVDSPGGTINGIPELASKIMAAREQKPIVASANSLMASAAYWLGAAATEVAATPSADVGSIGVFTIHEDVSAALEMGGVKPTIISAGKFKVEGNPFEPLGDEARATLQARVDEAFNEFVSSVAQGRGVSVSDVRNGFGQGRAVSARTALNEGMIDRIETLDETIQRVARGRFVNRGASRAEIEPSSIAADSAMLQRRRQIFEDKYLTK